MIWPHIKMSEKFKIYNFLFKFENMYFHNGNRYLMFLKEKLLRKKSNSYCK